jgi:uncharacterized protein (TIGR03435 family)
MTTMNICVTSVIWVSAIGVLAAQNTAAPLKFEAASVKPAERCSMENSIDDSRIALNGDPLNVVLMEAFKVKMDQIDGPSWLEGDCIVINAKLPDGASKDQVPAMLQALLAERFGLAYHKESRTRPGYALVVDKNGPKVKASDGTRKAGFPPSGGVAFGATLTSAGIKGSMTMDRLAHFLSSRVSAPVEDLTGLTGKYDVDISWGLDPSFERPGPYAVSYAENHPDAPVAPTPTADLFTAVRDSLGLKLESHKEPVEFVVIDHIERLPTGN